MIPAGIGMQNRGGFLQGASSATAELENAIASISGTSTEKEHTSTIPNLAEISVRRI
jgi:hypothetical protein